MKKTFRPAALTAALVLAFGASLGTAAVPAAPTSGLDRQGMDGATRVQDDLFEAMNGNWLKTTEIPGDKAAWGSGSIVRQKTDTEVHALVDSLLTQSNLDGERKKIADFYRADLDTAAMDRAGLAPLQPQLARVDAIHDVSGLLALMGEWQNRVSVPIGFEFDADADDPTMLVAQMQQSGLGLPDREYLLQDDERFVKARQAYLAYAEKLLALSGDAQAAAHAQAVLALETKMAKPMWARVEMRDPKKTYNPMKADGLAKLAPGVDWKVFLSAARLGGDKPLQVVQPSYFTALAQLLQSEPLETWKLYLKVRRLDSAAPVLSKPFRDARFAYRGTALAGLEQEPPRWQIAVNDVNAALGEAVGKIYVERNFPPAAKARIQALVGNLMKAYSTSIDGLTWMSPATKAAAHEKLSKYMLKVGYPDVWRDYAALEVRAGDALGNRDRGAAFEHDREVLRVGGKVDRTEWHMTPQTVNAYYNPGTNEIVFPAAILQPPFFDMKADDAVNYGAIGAIIGHEISHGFDDQGSQYDADGRLRNWWTEADRKAFEALTAKLAAQFDAYEPIKGQHVNGKLTLGENIADLSGLQIAYKAYEISLNGQKSPVIDGLTGEQRFFLGYAQSWRVKMRDPLTLQLLTSDPHSPGQFRADGASINHDGFHEAFGTKPGDGMWKAPADRIRIW
jgi:putative endopeptidase